MYQILKKEITAYLSSLVAYITIGAFLLVMGLLLWVFPESSILDYGYAGLDGLFSTAPYLLMFLIPAITMRSLAEERREGTFELLATRPLTNTQIVLGKYLACVVLLLFTLLPTLFYYYTVYQLGLPVGNVDTGGVIGSYIGLFLLGCAFTAIGIFASGVTRNQIIAFVIAVFLCFFFYSGFDSLGGLFSLQDSSIQQLGITEHYQSVSRGVLDTRDLAYFIILSALFILLTLFALIRQQQRKVNVKSLVFSIVGMAILLVLANLGFTRFDFTKEKRYTISQVSRDMMDSLDHPVTITVFLKGDKFPSGMKRLQFATRDMLSDLQAYSHGKLQFDIVDPLAGQNQQQQEQTIQNLQSHGVQPTNLSVATDGGQEQKIIFPAAIVSSGKREVPVNLLQTREGLSDEEQLNNSIQNLEYAFASAIHNVISGGRRLVGFTVGHNELTDLQLYSARKDLFDAGYDVGRFNLANIPFDSLKKINLVVIPKPDKPFSELEKFKLDQYIMNGGSVLWTIDQVSAELDSLRGHGGEQLTFPKTLNLDDQLFRYGVRLNYDLIADMSCSQIPLATGNVGGQAQIQMVPWLFYPVFVPQSKHPVVKNLDGIRSQFAGTMDTLEVKNVKKTVLITSSPYSKKLKAPYMLSLQAVEQTPDPRTFLDTPKNVGVLLEGKFISDFRNRPTPEGLGEQIKRLDESKPARMIVISDGDILRNDIGTDGSPYPLGYDHYMHKSFGNRNLLLNIADFMTGDQRLISLRSKEIQLRLLDKARVRADKMLWQLLNTVCPLGIVLIFAIFQHYLRRKKYAV
ncbi:protein involved in gliding motility GldG [Mucilaginibacter yixingensis]|uniref:Protein involved in gliding motility GldG n=1 Tax=Mucilaginibacter yixingensis TaxID=1295612 RepID=A0A2T5JEM3_9SPHI|nr:gliding motility-associated ABC transporter substrate-binding protein GldG [Mucilaginibacter yixingensis]PTR00888.1 protein involved in gliding motility GldG [Mucilaginibacter yixingensis]